MNILRKQVMKETGREATLYRVAFILNGEDILFEHMWAEDALHAKNVFCCMYPNRRTHEIIGVAPRIGMFAADQHADVVIA